MPSVLYNVQGEEGDDSSHPNCFRASFSSTPPTLSDFITQFPLAAVGTFHYRFKEKTDDFGFVWKDVKSLDRPVPLYNGLIWAKVMQVSGEPTRAAPVAKQRPVRSSASPRTKSPAAGRGAGTASSSAARSTSRPSESLQPGKPSKRSPTVPAAAHSSSNAAGRAPAPKVSASNNTHPVQTTISTDHIGMGDITLAAGFEEKSEIVQGAMIQRAKELKARQDAKIAAKKKKEEAAEALKLAKRDAEKSTGAVMDQWARDSSGGAKKLRTLLCELPKVLWEGTKWKPVDMGDVMDPKRVRVIYYKAMRIVHPDKLKAGASPEQKVRAERIFDALNNSWKIFQAHEM